MKILYIFRSIAIWGGIERILVDKMNYLVERYGMDVYLLTTDQGSHPVPFKLSAKVHHLDLNICFYKQYRYHFLKRFFYYERMLRQFESLVFEHLNIVKPDLIVCTTADHIGSIARVKGGIPLIVESHSICIRTIEHGKFWLQRKVYRRNYLRALSKVNSLVALTEGDAQEWKNYHLPVCVIPNFVHQHKECLSDLQSKRVIFVGRFDYQKRVQDAIQIWRIVKKHHPDWVLDIFGEGEMLEEVKTLASNVGSIIVHQPSYKIFEAYSNSAFLILTSLFEPFGLVLPEAMSCGLPVVAFDCPYGPADIVTDGKNGYLVKEHDIKTFADKVCQLIENDDMRCQMGQYALSSSRKYKVEVVMPSWIKLFESTIRI